MTLRSVLFFSKSSEPEQASMQSLVADKEKDVPKREDFKNMWLRDPIVRHGIRMNTDLITAGMTINSDNPSVDTDIKALDINTPIKIVIEKLTRDSQVFGTSFTEFMYSSKNKKVMGLWNMDPVRVDFTRDQLGNVLLNPDTTVQKYIEEIPFGRQSISSERDLYGRSGKFFTKDKVSHFSFEQFPGTIDGISKLHSGYKLIKDSWSAENGVVEALKRFGIPIYHVNAGDERYRINKEGMKKVKKELSGLTQKSVIITPHWQKLSLLYPDNIRDISRNLTYFFDQKPIILGIPRALILESGESTNRATLRQQIRLYISRLEKERERLSQYLLGTLFKKVGEVNGWKDNVPKITFDPITLEDIESYADRMGKYVQAGILTPEHVRKDILRIEKLDEIEEPKEPEEPGIPEDEGFKPPEESEEEEPKPEEEEPSDPKKDGDEEWKET